MTSAFGQRIRMLKRALTDASASRLPSSLVHKETCCRDNPEHPWNSSKPCALPRRIPLLLFNWIGSPDSDACIVHFTLPICADACVRFHGYAETGLQCRFVANQEIRTLGGDQRLVTQVARATGNRFARDADQLRDFLVR